jgi:hypothetical protein
MHRFAIGIVLAVAAAGSAYAGETLSTYESVTGAGPLSKILGQFQENSYAALYRIHIADPAAFSANTANPVTGGLDTKLYLFTLAGTGIAGNDDDSDSDVRSTLPQGNPLYAGLPPGDYLLGVSTFDSAPYDGSDFELIPDFTNGVNGPNPDSHSGLSYWGHDPISPYGPYEIDLTGAAFVTAVKLNLWTTPSSGITGVSYVNLTVSGVPAGTVNPANVSIPLANACGGQPAAVVVAASVIKILGSSYRIEFQIPPGLAPGIYFAGVNENGSGDANFVNGTCSELMVSN